jgi:PAS domain S-box-containing protein
MATLGRTTSRNIEVLIVEDSPTQAEHLKYTLEENGYAVFVANNGKAALALLQQRKPTMVISDIVMPEMDGYELCQRIKSNETLADIPVILLTSLADPKDVIQGLECGADNFIVKPYDEEYLLSGMEYIISNRELRRRERVEMGVEIFFAGQKYFINSERRQILDLLLSTYEAAVKKNTELLHAQSELKALNEQLERKVEERTAALKTEIAERQRAEETLRRYAERLKVLHEIDQAILAAQLPETIAQAALHPLRQLVPCQWAGIVLFDLEANEAVRLAVHANGETWVGAGTRLSLEIFNIDELLQGKIHVIEGIRQLPLPPAAIEALQAAGVRSYINVPLVAQGALIGCLSLGAGNPSSFSDEHLNIAREVADQLAIAIQSARLYEQGRQAEARYRDLYENAPDGYHTVDADGVVREMNDTQLNWLGYDRDEVVGRMRYEDLLASTGRRIFAHLLERCRRDGHLKTAELELVREDGRPLPVRLNMMALRDAAGQYLGCRATVRDITKERELEAQLLQAQKLESLGTLVGGIAHDFNNMLTGILGFAQLLLLDVEPGGRVYEGLQRVELLSGRAANMVKQLLAFSRQDVSQKVALLLHPFLKETSKLLERMIPENIEIDLRLAAEELVVEADPTQLQQVVMNLTVNARDAMPGGGQLRIETVPVEPDETFYQMHLDLQPGRYVRLSVGDTGMGIPLEIRSRIFDPFFTTKAVGKGTGLGLPVVYGIVKNHNGAIDVESQVGLGTTMRVYLPLTEERAAEADSSPVEAMRGTETILLVEDEPTVLEFGQVALEYLGYRMLTAQDGVEALAIYEQHQKDIALVILDVVMPKLGGRETFNQLKRLNPMVKALLATGYDTAKEISMDPLESGICGLVRKPYQIQELAQAVRAALEHP